LCHFLHVFRSLFIPQSRKPIARTKMAPRRRNYSSRYWSKLMKRYAKCPEKAYGALAEPVYRAFRRRLKKRPASGKYCTGEWLGRFRALKGRPADAYKSLPRRAYTAFRRWLKKGYTVDIELCQGRYNAHTKTEEREFMKEAITLAGTRPKTCSGDETVHRTAQELYLSVVQSSGKPPRYAKWVGGLNMGKIPPSSNKYMQRVQRQNGRLWKQLKRTIERNDREASA